jgi:Spy/CpxP family protein refolding chaperone
VRKTFALIALVGLFGATAFARQAAQPRSTAAKAPPTVEETLKAVRADLQAGRADIVAKNVSLTSEQAAKFWPVFEQYQKEQNAIMDAQMRDIQKYVDTYQTLDDATAVSLMNAHFDLDLKMTALRQKWLPEFQKVIGAKLAVRVMQIDGRLSLAHQMQFAAQIPLVY